MAGWATSKRTVSKSKRRSSSATGFTDLKRKHGVPEKLFACHTALIDGYIIEGHVPADLIDKLLKRKTAGTRARRSRHARRFTGHGRRQARALRGFDLRQERPDDGVCDAVRNWTVGVME